MFAGIGAVGRIGRPGLSGSAALAKRPSLALDFMQPGSLDSRITFTRASSATYTDASGVIQTAATNAPRWDYSGGALRGLLIEEARTNIIFPSIAGGANWSLSAVTLVPGSGIAPDATNTFVKMANTATTSFHGTQIAATGGLPNTTYTSSVYARRGEFRYLQLIFDDLGGGNPASICTFDLQTNTVSSGAGIITNVGNGIYRCSMTGTTGGATTQVRLGLNNSTIPNPGFYDHSYLGVAGEGTYIWGAQVEQGAFVTSYIPTTSGAVTRAVDSCRILPASMGWFTAGPGSWFAEFISQTTPTPSAPRIIGYPIVNGKTPLYVGTTNQIGVFDGNAVVTSANTFVRDATAKAVSTWMASTGKICLNGGAVATGPETMGFLDAASTGIALLQTGTAVESSTGYIRRISWWPRVLSDAEMQQVTT